MVTDETKTRLLYKVAKAYYEDGLTYEQIGSRFGFSRMKVARLLEQAKDEKIVQIIIAPPPADLNTELERQLEAKYGLDEAVIVSPPSYDQAAIVQELGPAAANYLLRHLQGDEVIGLAWGNAMLSVVNALPIANWAEMKVVSTTGGLGRLESETYGADLVRRMAQAFGAKPHIIMAPGIVNNRMTRDALLADPQISEALALAAKADIILVGIGKPTVNSILRQSGLTELEINQLQDNGAVGDIVFRFFDANGQPIDHEINDRIIGLNLDQLKGIPRVIGVAGGLEKLDVIRAALRGKLIKVLVTDDKTVFHLLKEEDTCLERG